MDFVGYFEIASKNLYFDCHIVPPELTKLGKWLYSLLVFPESYLNDLQLYLSGKRQSKNLVCTCLF